MIPYLTNWWGSLLVVALVAPVLLGGLRSIARAAELIAPLMAAAYLALVAVIILMIEIGRASCRERV